MCRTRNGVGDDVSRSHKQSRAHTPEKLLPDGVIQTLTPTEVERGGADSTAASSECGTTNQKDAVRARKRHNREESQQPVGWKHRRGIHCVSAHAHMYRHTHTMTLSFQLDAGSWIFSDSQNTD